MSGGFTMSNQRSVPATFSLPHPPHLENRSLAREWIDDHDSYHRKEQTRGTLL